MELVSITTDNINDLLLKLLSVNIEDILHINYLNKKYIGSYLGIVDNNIILLKHVYKQTAQNLKDFLSDTPNHNFLNIKDCDIIFKDQKNSNSNKILINHFIYTSEFNQYDRIIYNVTTEQQYPFHEMLTNNSGVIITCYLIDKISIFK